MWSASPDVITYTSVVSPDLPAAAMGTLACYIYWRWLTTPNRRYPIWPAVTVALAVLCKFSWLMLIPLLPITTIIHDCWKFRAEQHEASVASPIDIAAHVFFHRYSRCVGGAAKLLSSFLLTLLLVNWCYGFQGTFTPLGDFKF